MTEAAEARMDRDWPRDEVAWLFGCGDRRTGASPLRRLFSACRATARRGAMAIAFGVIASIAVAPLAENAVAAPLDPGVTTDARPALKVRRRTYEGLSRRERAASDPIAPAS